MTEPVSVATAAKRHGWSLAKIAVKALAATQSGRRALGTLKRGFGAFNIPRAPMLIVIPDRHGTGVGTVDADGAQVIAGMLSEMGYRQGKDWEIKAIREAPDALTRQRSLIILCGANPIAEELLRPRPAFLKSIQYTHAVEPLERSFSWRNQQFRWDGTRDFAIIAVKKNPDNPKSRLVLLAGLRSFGTRGACLAYAHEGYKDLRRRIMKEYGTKDGDLEVLLAIDHAQDGTIRGISVADPYDPSKSDDSAQLHPVKNDPAALRRIYNSLHQFPRSVLHSGFVYELTYLADYAVKVCWEETLTAHEDDVVVLGRNLSSDRQLRDVTRIGFQAEQLEPAGEEAVGHSIVHVLVMNSWLQRSYLLFPIPPIRRGERGRRFRITGRWPEAGHKLRTVAGSPSRESVHAPRSTTQPFDRVTIRLLFDLPGTYRVQPMFPLPDNKRLPTDGYATGRPFEITVSDVLPGTEFVLEVTRLT